MIFSSTRGVLVGVLAGASCLAALPAAAQVDAPKIPRAYGRSQNSGWILHKFAGCVSRGYPREVDGFFNPRADVKSRNERVLAFLKAHKSMGCLRAVKMRVDTRILLGALAEQLFAGTPPAVPAAASAPTSVASGTYRWTADRMSDEDADKLEAIAECVNAADPAGVRTLLATQAVSSEERDAFAAVHPALSGCIQSPNEVTLHPMMIRAAIAETLYLGAQANKGAVN